MILVTIRKATFEDASAIATVHVASWKETYHGIVSDEVLNNLSIERRTAQWVSTLSDEANQFHRAFVAEVDGQVTGFANYGVPQLKATGFDGELLTIYILRSAHKQGLGRALVREVVKGMHELGWKSMMAWVLKDNPARGFYERLGGTYLYDKPIEIGGESLMESAYGWRELDSFPV